MIRPDRLHRVVGSGGLGGFLATGLSVHFGPGHLRELDDATRLLYRRAPSTSGSAPC